MESDELELGLGLSLSGSAWGERGRILTARDFPYVGSKRSAADSVSSQVVGWPPVGAYRMNSLIGQLKTQSSGDEEEEGEEEQEEEEEEENQSKKKEKEIKMKKKKKKLGFVKVNLDGMPIGRKVDLRVHACYESLAYSIEDMFFRSNSSITSLGKCPEKEKPRSAKLLDGSSDFVLTYEDKEGDWMLVGDVPWRMFLSSVRRLRIMRTSEANGLDPRFQEHRERQRARPV